MELDYKRDRVCVSCCLDSEKRLGGGCVLLFWTTFPWIYAGGVSINEVVFGKGIMGVGEMGHLLAVEYKTSAAKNGHLIRLYDFMPFWQVLCIIRLPIYLSVGLSLYLHSYLSVCRFVCLTVCLFGGSLKFAFYRDSVTASGWETSGIAVGFHWEPTVV